ncbi:MAG: prenyltransferase/squalene oxidase repeat-containing protein [Thermoguttaceae bacterium]|jgi:hypothetical protein
MNAPEPSTAAPGAAQAAADQRAEQLRTDRVRRLVDVGSALGLLLALLVVFAVDCRQAGLAGIAARRVEAEGGLFDPIHAPMAEVRQHPHHEQWIGPFGGSEQSEAAVRLGLEWLARHQADDGHWGPDCLHPAPDGRCQPGGSCTGPGSEHRIALTGLALLAFQAGGHYDFNGSEFSASVGRGLDWLVRNQRADGCLLDTLHGAGTCNMYEHGIAAFALADACEMAVSLELEPADRYCQAAARAVSFIEYVQHKDGGWRYTEDRDLPSDTSVSGWQVLALKAAKRARVAEVGQQCVEQVEQFFRRCETGPAGQTGYMPGQILTPATTGVGMLVHEFILERPDSPLVQQGAKYLADLAEQSWRGPVVRRRRFAAPPEDFYAWYNCTLAMFQAGGQPWKRWNDVVRNGLIDCQCLEAQSCARGSWDPLGRWAPQGGRIYSTALAVLTLEVYYRYKSERAKVYK